MSMALAEVPAEYADRWWRRPLWRLCRGAARALHQQATGGHPWRVLIRHGLKASDGKRGRDLAATMLVPFLCSWVELVVFLIAGSAGLSAAFPRWDHRWIVVLQFLPVLVSLPWLVIAVLAVGAARSTRLRLLQRLETAVIAMNPRPSSSSKPDCVTQQSWYDASRARRRHRRRLVSRSWQISSDLALLGGRARRERELVGKLGRWLILVALEPENDARRRVATELTARLVEHVTGPTPWAHFEVCVPLGQRVLVRPRLAERLVSAAQAGLVLALGATPTVVGVFMTAALR